MPKWLLELLPDKAYWAVIIVIVIYGPKYIREISHWISDRNSDRLKRSKAKLALKNNLEKKMKRKGGKK